MNGQHHAAFTEHSARSYTQNSEGSDVLKSRARDELLSVAADVHSNETALVLCRARAVQV